MNRYGSIKGLTQGNEEATRGKKNEPSVRQSHQEISRNSAKVAPISTSTLQNQLQARQEVSSTQTLARLVIERKEQIKALETERTTAQRMNTIVKSPDWRTFKTVAAGAAGNTEGVRHTAARTGGASIQPPPLLAALFSLEDMAALIEHAYAAHDAYIDFLPPADKPKASEAELDQEQAALLAASRNAWQTALEAANDWPAIHIEIAKVMQVQEGRVLLWGSQKKFVRAHPHSAKMQKAFAEFKRNEIESARSWLDKVVASELAKAKAAAADQLPV